MPPDPVAYPIPAVGLLENIDPDDVRLFKVPTLRKLELITLLPNVVEFNTGLVPILYALPEAKSIFSLLVHEAVAELHCNVLSDPPLIINPAPLAVISEGLLV